MLGSRTLRDMSMREVGKWSAFILLIIGTIGLLMNELILDWGGVTALTFAALNVIGLAILAFTTWGIKKKPRSPKS